MHFKKFLTVQKENQIKYGLIKAVLNSSFKKWLKEIHMEMYSAYNEVKSVSLTKDFLDMVLDLIGTIFFHNLVVEMIEM